MSQFELRGSRMPLSWERTGEWMVSDGSSVRLTGSDLPAFLALTRQGFRDLMNQGTDELPATLLQWMGRQMTEASTSQPKTFGSMHEAFNGVFPVPGLPPTVAPEFAPFIEVVPPWSPDRSVIVQPMILTPMALPKVFVYQKVAARAYEVPKRDPFALATLEDGRVQPLPTAERGHLRELIRSFWQSISAASEYMPKAQLAQMGNRRLVARETMRVLDEAAASLSEVTRRIIYYVLSQENSPFSPRSRAIILLPWLFKAAEAWAELINHLAQAGKVELPDF